ncbi:hypothetical protein HWB05_gp063 [Streptomyces phage BRock]|uniref:Uncharacterized protein n=1 Tax=Streptomyces phage BRock TaxID=1913591 RepID=A0A1J0GVX4_9CAUD|nr:hypothetical protein HWB05_gp063 [Streptomyces phage BRock]APC46325.1 hypothetical protein [Streptomyces phage BRock]
MSAAQQMREFIAHTIRVGNTPEQMAEDIVRALRFGPFRYLITENQIYAVLETSIVDSAEDEIAWTVYTLEA